MAAKAYIINNVNQETVVKITGATGADVFTIDLDDATPVMAGATAAYGATGAIGLLANTQLLTVGGTPTVNIVGVIWTGHFDTMIHIDRAGERVMSLPSTGSTVLEFAGQAMPPDNSNNTSDIVVTFTNGGGGNDGGAGEVWLKLRKTDGYSTKVETSTYSIYDDTSVVGS